MTRPYVIGLTGGIAAGKTTVGDYFRQFGLTVLEADDIARQLSNPGTDCWDQMAQHFAPLCQVSADKITRTHIREVIFNNEDERHWLEDLLHPPVIQTLQKGIDECSTSVVIAVVPLLIEKPDLIAVDRHVVVYAERTIRLQRLIERDHINPELANQIIDTQAPAIAGVSVADDIIINDLNEDHLEYQARMLYREYLTYSSPS